MLVNINNQISDLISSKVLIDEPLKKHTSFGIGGNASFYIYPENKTDLKNILQYSFINNIKVFFIGSGSNLLVSDNGFNGIVICLRKTFKNFIINKNLEATIGSGVMLGNMVKTLT